MAADDRPSEDLSDQVPDTVRDALFAADLKRLVRASKDEDEGTVSRLRDFYLPE